MMFDVYGVGAKGHNDRHWVGRFEDEASALACGREALWSGFVYCYIKREHEVVSYLLEGSPLTFRLIEQTKAERRASEGSEELWKKPLLRIELC